METDSIDDSDSLRLSVLQQLEIVASGNCDEEFLKSLRTEEVNVNWLKIYNLFKKQLSETLTDKFNEMWKEENLSDKINSLNILKEKYKDEKTPAWRPTTGNIQPQSTSFNIQLLTELKENYTTLVTQKEEDIAKLKEELKFEWDKIKLHRSKICEAENYNQTLCRKINERLEENIDTMSQAYNMLAD